VGTSTIFVALLGENVDVWRPVDAEPLSSDAYRITGANPDPEGEVWEFVTGELVRCEPRRFDEESPVLVAVEKIELRGFKQPFLVCDDYGQGGIWAFVVAESASQIRTKYPSLFIADRIPAWVTPEVMSRLPSHDLHAPPTGLLAVLERDRARSN